MRLDYSALHWTTLRSVGNSFAVKLTILVPLIGYAIIFNDQSVSYLEVSEKIVGARSQGVSWRLIVTYFGLLSLALGSVIYIFGCHEIVKMFPAATAYVGEVLPNISNYGLRYVDEQLAKSPFAEDVKKEKEFCENSILNLRAGETEEQFRRQFNTEAMTYYFMYLNLRYWFLRFASAFFYLLGFAILLVPTLDIFFKVFFTLLRNLGLT